MVMTQSDILNGINVVNSSSMKYISFNEVNRAIELSFSTENYEALWDFLIFTSKTYKSHDISQHLKSLDSLFDKIYKIKNTGKIIAILNGVEKYLSDSANNIDINQVIAKYSRDILLYAASHKKTKLIPLLGEHLISKNVESNSATVNMLLERKDTETILTLMPILTNWHYNNDIFLKDAYNKGINDFSFYQTLIDQYNFDINLTSSYLHKVTNEAFVHLLFLNNGNEESKLVYDFIEHYSDKIDFNSTAVYPTSNNVTTSYDLIGLLFKGNVLLPVTEKLNRLHDCMVKNIFNEKHLGRIGSFIFNKYLSSSYYDHKIYDAFFKSSSFHSPTFNKNLILNNILQNDHSSEFDEAIKRANTNPTIVLLTKFFNSVDDNFKPSNHPFFIWANNMPIFGNYRNSSFDYLFNHYEADIRSFNQQQLSTLNRKVRHKLNSLGINTGKAGLINSIFSWKKTTNTEVETPTVENFKPENVQHNSPIETLAFNTNLFDTIKDPEIKHLINLITLNAEQFFVVFDKTADYQHEYYMRNTLPMMLNRTVDTYLGFLAISPDKTKEAKETSLVHLQLLSGKTFDVLSSSLEAKKENLNKENRVNSKLLNKL